MPKIKILYVITKDDVGGAQKYVNDLAKNIDKERFEIKIVTGGKNGVRFLSNNFRPYFLFINDWLALVEFFLLLRREKPDILHLNSSKAGVIGSLAARLYNILSPLAPHPSPLKVIFTVHGWVFNPDNNLSWLRRRFYIFLHKIAARFQDKIINVSEYDRKLALQYKIASAEKLVTIYNGIDYENLKFLDKITARKAIIAFSNPKPYALNPSEVWIGSIGRLVAEKNYSDLIQAAAHIKNPEVKFFIIGGGPEYQKLKAKSEKLKVGDRFFIVENLAPAAPYLKAFDIFALSSIKEGLPYTMLEAMAAERPIVVTRVGGMPEIIDPQNSDKRGLVMPPQEPEELARAFDYILQKPEEARKMAEAAKKHLQEKMTLKKMVEETTLIYQSLL